MKKNLLKTMIGMSLFISSSLFSQVPTANFSISPNPVCSGTIYPVQITDMSTGSPLAWSYTMTGAAPATSTLQNPMITYANPGTFTITLIAINGAGPSAPAVKTITVLPSPNVLINPVIQSMCAGSGPLVFTDMAVGPGVLTFSWNSGPATNSISVSPTVTTSYTCTATNTIGCSAVRTCTAVVNPLPSVTLTASPPAICPGSSSTLSVSVGPGPYTYSWSTGGTTSNITTSLTGVYSVTVTNSTTLCKSIKTYTLGTPSSLTLTATATPSAICSGNNSTLTVTGATSYTWSSGPTTNFIVVTPTITTTYSVLGATGTCTGSTTVMVTVNTTPTVTATSSSTSICVGSSATLSAVGAITYTWNPGALIGANVVVTPTTTTLYNVTGANGNCLNVKNVVLTVLPVPVVNATANPSLICSGQTATLIASGTASTYTWNPGGPGTSITVSPTVTTTYSVTGTATTNCTNTSMVTVSVSACLGINEIVNAGEYSIFPNPTSGKLTIKVGVTKNTMINAEVVDVSGKSILKQQLNFSAAENNQSINIANLANGLYFIKLTNSENKTETIRIVKE